MSGIATGVAPGTRLVAWTRASGQKAFVRSKVRVVVGADGTFRWSQRVPATKGIRAYVSYEQFRSNRVTWSAAEEASATVYFTGLSARLTDEAKATLRKLVKGRKSSVIRIAVDGYVQRTSRTDNDRVLSKQRADVVAAYLKEIGTTGVVDARGRGAARERGMQGRRATVTVTFSRR